MRNFWLILSVLWLWTCSGGGDKATGPEEPPIVINLTSLGGQAQKGPFNNGTAINIAELTSTLSPTGRNFSSAITDNTGRFAVANVQLESPYVELRANGFYFNEVTNEISDAQLTLFAISNLTGKTSLNVNILTHLEKNRIVNLMSGDNPKTFAQAKLQAQEEVLAIFDYSRANVPESELLDISQDGAANAKLLAMSAIIQGDLTVGQMSQLLANMSTDIASDGTLDDTNLRNTLIENSKNLDMEEVRSNLVAHYTSLGISATIPDFETEVNQFLKPPVANDMSASTGEDTPINITLAGSDPEGESLTYTILEVNNATVTLNGNVANYTPNVNFNGTDTFTYYVNDGISDSNIATVTMTVSAEDDDPNTQNAAATTDEDVAVELQLTAEEYDGDNYSIGIISQPSNGSVTLDGANATYTPNQDYNGTDSFTFEATDDTGRVMNVGTATITINPVNDAPVLTTTSVSVSVDEEQSVSFTIDATDVDGDQLTFIATNQDAQNQPIVIDGTVNTNGNTFIYTPYSNDSYELPEGSSREDFFYYYAQDSSGEKTQYGSAYISVTGVDDLPHADNLDISLNENSNVYITLTSTDPDGGSNESIDYEITQSPTNGSVSLNNNIVEYTPNSDFYGNDSFKFKVTGDNQEGIVNITINEVFGITRFFELDSNYHTYAKDVVHDKVNDKYVVSGVLEHKHNQNADMEAFIATFNNDLTLNNWHKLSINPNNGSYFTDDLELKILSDGSYLLWNNNTIHFMNSDHSLNKELYFPDESLDNVDSNGGFDIGSIIEDSGSLVVTAAAGISDNTYRPIIIKLDMNGNINYYNLFESNNLDTDDYSYRFRGYARSIKSVEANKYLIAGSSFRTGWTCNNYTSIFEVEDTGSTFQLIEQYNEPNPDCSVSSDAGDLIAVSIAPIYLTNATTSNFYVAGTSNNDFIVQWFEIDNNQMTKKNESHSIYIQDFRDKGVEIISDPDNPNHAYLIASSTTAYIYLYKYFEANIEWGGSKSILPGKNTDDFLGGIDIINSVSGVHGGRIIFSGFVNNHDDNIKSGYLMILDQNGQ